MKPRRCVSACVHFSKNRVVIFETNGVRDEVEVLPDCFRFVFEVMVC